MPVVKPGKPEGQRAVNADITIIVPRGSTVKIVYED